MRYCNDRLSIILQLDSRAYNCQSVGVVNSATGKYHVENTFLIIVLRSDALRVR